MLFLTNRLFIFQVVALLFALLGMVGVILPIEAADVAEIVGLVGYLAAQGLSLGKRLNGKTRAIWSKDQAAKAVQEADALRVR